MTVMVVRSLGDTGNEDQTRTATIVLASSRFPRCNIKKGWHAHQPMSDDPVWMAPTLDLETQGPAFGPTRLAPPTLAGNLRLSAPIRHLVS